MGGGSSGDAVGDGARDTRIVVGGAAPQDELRLSRHGRTCYCDYHDPHGGCRNACMAMDMLQQREIAALVEKHQHARDRATASSRSGAQHAMYKGVWSGGSGQTRWARKTACACQTACCTACAVCSQTRAAERAVTTSLGASARGTTVGSSRQRNRGRFGRGALLVRTSARAFVLQEAGSNLSKYQGGAMFILLAYYINNIYST